ncbi:MAG: sensor histidine kinase [Anaerolineae bacterium]|nr:sensor histidine kinase [Anaerolineae bacterium]
MIKSREKAASQTTSVFLADLHNDDINRLRSQLWMGLMVTTFCVLFITLIARHLRGDPTPPMSLLIQGSLYAVVFANVLLRKTRHANFVQGIYVVCIHLAVPTVFVLYGGTRGFGDVALLTAVIVSMLYGWRRWMIVTYGAMVITLIWVLYRDSIGEPVTPLLDYSAQFTALKFVIVVLVMTFILRYTNAFYKQLIEKYRNFANEQVRLNLELQANELQLTQLTRNLQSSRQKIVTAREEERRRLRRDLHDGLGPMLAAQVFRVGAARQVLHRNPDKTEKLLIDLEGGIEGTLADIRQLVYGLRPPMLDQLGLVGSITNFVQRNESNVRIELEIAPQLPPLSAAIEVAVYRIVQTAVDNVIKHAQATHCQVRLFVRDDTLHTEITDDGIGISPSFMAGVGLTSMRERSEELGGTLQVLAIQPKGTRLTSAIPLIFTHD